MTGTLTDTDVDNTANTFQAVPRRRQRHGYGTYSIDAAGDWTYTLDNNNAAVQALNVGGTLTDTFTVTTADGTAQPVTITINGANDAAVISGTSTGAVTEAGGVNNAIAGYPDRDRHADRHRRRQSRQHVPGGATATAGDTPTAVTR